MAIHKTLAVALIGMAAISKVVRADTDTEGDAMMEDEEDMAEEDMPEEDAMGGDDEDMPDEEDEEDMPEEDMPEEDMPEEEDAMGCMSVLEVATAQGNAAFLEAASSLLDNPGAADLVAIVTAEEELPEDEMVTIFLPTESAFEDAMAASLDAATLVNVLLTHVVPGVVTGDDVLSGSATEATAANGEMLELTDEVVASATVAVVGSDADPAAITTFDQMTCAGPVHIITKVLLPMGTPPPLMGAAMEPMMAPAPAPGPMGPAMAPRGLPEQCMDVATALALNPDTAELAATATEILPADALALLSDPSTNLTVLAPPNDLVSRLAGGIQSEMLSQEEAIAILSLHVIPDFLMAEDLIELDGMSIMTASPMGDELMVMVDMGMVMFMSGNTTATVVMADIDGCGAAQIIHQIDGVLLPEGVDVDVDSLPEATGAPGTRDLGAPAPDEAGTDGSSAAGTVGALVATAAAALAVLVL